MLQYQIQYLFIRSQEKASGKADISKLSDSRALTLSFWGAFHQTSREGIDVCGPQVFPPIGISLNPASRNEYLANASTVAK